MYASIAMSESLQTVNFLSEVLKKHLLYNGWFIMRILLVPEGGLPHNRGGEIIAVFPDHERRSLGSHLFNDMWLNENKELIIRRNELFRIDQFGKEHEVRRSKSPCCCFIHVTFSLRQV